MNNIILKHRKFKEDLVNLINEAELPAFILKPVIDELLEQLKQLEETQYEQAVELQNQNKEKEDKKKRGNN